MKITSEERNALKKEIAEEAANVALGYMYAIADILQVTKGVSNADSIVRAWADEVEEKEGAVLE